MLCAVARQNNRLHLVPTRYTLPTDAIPIVSICGLPNGKIFMGGHDGSLYEFSYENLVTTSAASSLKTFEQRSTDYYDGTASSIKVQNQLPSVTSQLVKSGKRTLSVWIGGGGSNGRATKCRKLNHSATGLAAAASTVVPDWLLRAPAAIFGADRASSLQKIVHDPERQCLYTLTARGCVGVYDLRTKELTLKATIDCDKIARLYLSAVAKGHMYAPSSNIEFAGGVSAAQSGVGGMDGARSILKLAESNAKAKMLTPISLHVIPRTDSSRLTLLAVTSGGLRYYITSLSQSSLSKSNLAPFSKMLLCHIRSPPPVDPATGRIKESFDEGDVPGGMIPRLLPHTFVDAASYSDGNLFLALRRPPQQQQQGTNGSSAGKEVGNIIVGTNADFIARKIIKKDNKTIRELPGGVAETVSLPTALLPGGRIIDASTLGFVRKSPLMKLTMNSQTPSDSELGVGLVPPYYPKVLGKEIKKQDEKKQPLSTSSLAAARSSTALTTTNKSSRPSSSEIAVRVLCNFMLSRPMGQGIAFHSALPTSTSAGGSSQPQVYRISNRYGSSGFSSTAGSSKSSLAMRSSKTTHTSVRLSPWLLRPAMIPLNEIAINHILSSTKTVAVSVGGIHYFTSNTILTTLADTLERSGHDVAQAKTLIEFFDSYGYKESCTLCLMLAIGSGPAKGNGTEDLKSRALNAAFGRGGAPRLDRTPSFDDGRDAYVVTPVDLDPLIPAGYNFVPSFLSEGVVSLTSRLLRPIWYKPAVVVTEGQIIKVAGSASRRFPAKVELLLNDSTLGEVRTPLFALKQAIQQCFRPAIEAVPGVHKPDSNQMDIDETTVLTGFMRFQGSMTPHGAANGVLSNEEAVSRARLIEERNLHSLYRLICRLVQLLDLLSLLKRAQEMFDLPEVEWGLLHGLTFSQLVESCDGQERIENLLNSLVSNTKAVNGSTVTPTADSDQLAKSLATQCYLFFSPASRFAYLGFRSANEARGCMDLSARRATLSKQAVEHFKMAANFWTSAQLITGRLMHTGEAETYEQKVNIALQYNSPLAKASSILLDIGEVVAIVDICTITASNFTGKSGIKMLTNGEQGGFQWEKTLYHDRKPDDVATSSSSDATGNSSKAIVVAASVTGQDAISTCHSVMLYHLLSLLKRPGYEDSKRMMVSACAASADKVFLKSLFDCLLKTGNANILLKIDSVELEKWLDEKQDAQLMWQYLMIQRKHMKAGDLMFTTAKDEKSVLPLDERVVFLERSKSAYNSAILAAQSQLSQPAIDVEALERRRLVATEHLELARLQQQTLKRINLLGLESQFDEGKLRALQTTLLDVSDLYNDYTGHVQFFDLCLRILHQCRDNSPYIETLWNSLICEHVFPCATSSETTYNFLKNLSSGSLIIDSVVLLSTPNQEGEILPLFESGTWVNPLKQKVESLGRDLFGTGADYVFPVELLVTSLEGEFRVEAIFVADLIITSGISPFRFSLLSLSRSETRSPGGRSVETVATAHSHIDRGLLPRLARCLPRRCR
jgi:nuclear pore complex protein Nup155